MIMISDLMTTRHMKKSSRISFNECGIEYCSPGHYNGPRVRYHCIIHFVLEGKGKIRVNKKKYTVQAGEAFLIPSNAEGYYIADKNEPWKYCWLSFAGTEAEQYAEEIFGKQMHVKKISCMDQVKKELFSLAEQFSGASCVEEKGWLESEYFHLYAADTASDYFRLNAGLFSILSVLLEESGRVENEPGQDGYAEKIKNYIDSYFMELSEVSQVAQLFHLHPNYLAAVFKEKYHISPKQYLLERKIYYANHLLTETENSVRYIASVCGFSDASSFGKVYKRHMGVTPGMYRELRRK